MLISDGEKCTVSTIITNSRCGQRIIEIITMYIYHALTNAMSAHMIYINLNMIFYTHIEHSLTKAIYIRCYKDTHTRARARSRDYSRNCVLISVGVEIL